MSRYVDAEYIKAILVDHTYEFRVDPKSEEVKTAVYLGGYVW